VTEQPEIADGFDWPGLITMQDLSPGDILLHSSADRKSKIIQFKLKSPYEHASIYLGNGEIAEATFFSQEQIRRASMSIPEGGHIAVFRCQHAFTSNDVANLIDFIDELISRGTPYDTTVIWQKKLRKRQQEYIDNSLEIIKKHFEAPQTSPDYLDRPYFCSGLVVGCYFAVGKFGPDIAAIIKPELYLPEDLGGVHFYFGHIVGYLADATYAIPENDPFRRRATYSSQGF
jgi:hypothetical protein